MTDSMTPADALPPYEYVGIRPGWIIRDDQGAQMAIIEAHDVYYRVYRIDGTATPVGVHVDEEAALRAAGARTRPRRQSQKCGGCDD